MESQVPGHQHHGQWRQGRCFLHYDFFISLTSHDALFHRQDLPLRHRSPSAGTCFSTHPSALPVPPGAGADLDDSAPRPGTFNSCLFSAVLRLYCSTSHSLEPQRLSGPWPTGILISVMYQLRKPSYTNFPPLSYCGTPVIS